MKIERALLWLVKALKLPRRAIPREEGKPYLDRYYLCGDPGAVLKYFPEGQRELRWWQRALTWLPTTYVHRFLASDDVDALHNHPWEHARSLILVRGYVEVVRVPRPYPHYDVTSSRLVEPLTVNRISGDTYHAVLLHKDNDGTELEAWTLFIAGPRRKTWFFWDVRTGETIPWKMMIDRRAAKLARERRGS